MTKINLMDDKRYFDVSTGPPELDNGYWSVILPKNVIITRIESDVHSDIERDKQEFFVRVKTRVWFYQLEEKKQ